MYQVSTYGTLCLLPCSLLHYSMLGIMYELFNETFKLIKTERKYLGPFYCLFWNLFVSVPSYFMRSELRLAE
jgi:hypothetical protein